MIFLLALSMMAAAAMARPHQPHVEAATRFRADNVRVDQTSDCAIKKLAWEYAVKLQGQLQPGASAAVHDALELATVCGLKAPLERMETRHSRFFPSQIAWKRNEKKQPHEQRAQKMSLFVDAAAGQSLPLRLC